MKKEKTIMKVECAWCGKPMGTKNGKGVTGTTSGICPECAAKEWAKLGGRPPARWNIIGRILYRRRQKRDHLARLEREHDMAAEADRKINEQAELEAMFAANPALHARVMLNGKPGVHYMNSADLLEIEGRVASQPEMTIRWN
jgi:hypothetical protein